MNKVVKWMMVVMLVSIDILTPFGNAELYDENVVSQINDEIEQEIEISVQEENQQYADEDLQSEEDEDEEQIGEEQIVTVIDEGITGGELEENDDVEKKDLMEDENLGEIGDLDNDLQEEEDKNMTKIVKDGYKNELNGSGNGIVENVINEIAENFMEEINIFDNNKLVESPFNPIEITGSRTIDEVTVNVLAPIGSFYSGTELVIQPVKTKVLNEIKNQLVEEQDEITEDSTVIAFDISFIYSGEEVQPLSGTVQVSFNYETNDELKQAVEDEGKEVQVYHINDKDEEGNITENKEIEKIDIVESSEGEVIVEAESFSIYTIVTQVAEEGPKAEAENQLANFVYGEISIARPDSFSEADYPIEGFTIMDRNLGAMITGAGASAPVESYGYHYQWGNNYGFNSNIVELLTSNIKLNVSGLTGYYSGLFIVTNKSNDNDRRKDTWMKSNNTDLWNGDSKQGPCPEGWHIPTNDEWIQLMIYWAKNNSVDCPKTSDGVKLNSGYTKFSNDFYFPYAGIRDFNASFLNVNILADYWSRSYKDGVPYGLFITDTEIYSRHSDGFIRGLSVRCFKDTYSGTGNMFKITYDFNGGSGSVVNQMVKSGSFAEKPTDPIKSGYIFNGWYISGTDMLYDFTQTVVEDIELYAKYICEDGKVNNGIQCIEKHGSSTLKQGDSFNNTLLSLTGVEDIIVIKKTDVAPSDEILITGNLARSGLPVIARYENVGGTGTIYYYSEALDIYMYSNSNGMFKNLSYLTELDIRDFNTTNVTTMGSMFYGCSSLLKLDVSNFNTSKVTSIADMFRGCSSLMYLDLSNFDTSKVTSMQSTFMGCSNLESLNISTFDTSSLKNISWTFDGCKNLRYLDLTSFDTTNITTMQRSFKGCDNLKIIYASEKFIATGSLTESFLNTTGVVGGNGTISSNKSGKYAHIDTEDNPGYFTDPNNFTVRFLSGDEIVTYLTGKVGEVAPTIQGDGRIYSYYSDSNKTIPYDFEQTLSGYTEIYVDYTELKANIKVGQTFSNIIKGIANNNLSNIYHFERAGSITNEIKANATQIQTNDSETEIYVWFEPDTNSGTVFYYTDSKTIYLQGDVGIMFSDWTNLRELDLSDFDSSGVTSMSAMFRGSNKLEQLNLSNFNTSNLTSMYEMFKGCSSLRELDLSNFDTSNVTSFESTFYGCNSLTNLNISGFDTSKAINMFSMFNGCSKLTELDVSHFNTSKVTNMQNMFGGCSSLTGLHLSNFDTSKVTNMGGMFYNMGKLTSLDLSNFDTKNVTSMADMFHGCSSLTGLNLSNFDTSKVTNMYEMFKGCSGLKDLNISNFNTANVTNMSYMFWRCNSLTELDLHSFVTTKVTNMSSMFNGASKLISLDVSNFDTSNTTNMGSMFGELHNITGIDLSNFDTSKVTDLGGMFYNMSNLEGLDLSNFDTKNVTSMADMFHGCSSLTGLDLSNFDTSKVTNMYEMFKGTTRLKIIYVGPNFTTGVASNTADMFRGTNALIGGNGTKWNSSFITGMYAQIDSESQSGYFTDPNNFTVRYLSGNEIVANLTGKVGGVATGLNDEGRIYSYYSDVSKTIPYDFTTPLTGYTEIYVDWIYENEDVTIETNNSEYGMVNDGDITVEYGSTITTSGNELMIDGNTIIATPNVSNNQYTYGFNGWANTCGSETNPTYFDEIIYKYEGDYKFDGSNYINTNVSLFSDENYQRDFEISFDIVNYNTSTESQGSFISVMNETGNPYPGIVFRRSGKNATMLELVSNGGVGTSIHEYNSSNVQNVKISRKNSKLYLQINGGENTEVYDYTNFNSFFNVPLTIGASLDGNGKPWRYIKATLSNIEVKFTDGIGVTNGEIVTGDCTITANFSRVKNSYPVTFNNYNGTILNEKTMEYGTTSQYVGDTPSKQGNVQYNYTFAGWDHQISQVTESQVYTATYTTELNQYTATIVSNNINSGTVNLGSVKADYNKSIVLSGNMVKIGETTVIATPKDSNEQYTYEFSGWNNMCGDLLAGDCTITAEFNSTVNKYLITFIDGDGNVIQSGMVEYGTIPVYLGNEPTKTKTAQYTYSFSGWDLELEEVTGQKTYTATFTQTLNKYNIIFVDEDGETVLGSGMYVYGTQSGDIVRPIAQKPATAEYTYTFAGWTPEIQEVTTGATYRATYSSTKNKYTIVWLDGDGNILKSEQIEYGKTPVYNGVVPTKTATQQYTYIFNNTWTPNIESVTTGAEYMAQFDSSINIYAVIINALPTGYGTVSSGSVVVNYGTTINVNSNVLLIGSETITATPIENDAQYTYIFSGWNNTCGNILQDNCTITAEFNRTVNEYIIKWEDGDGNIIWSGMYEYGVLPEYSGPTPTKVSTDEYNYTFNGLWLPSIHVVTGDAEYLAQFDGDIIRKESRNEQSGAGRRKKDISDIEIHLSAEENSSTGNVDVLDKPYKSEDDSYGFNTNISKDSSSQILGGQTEFEQAYNFAKLNGITTTPSIQKAKMNTNITRIQMAKMLSYYAINVLGKIPDTERGITKFNDVTNKMDKQYDNGVTLAYQLGIMGINMKNNSFRPNDEVTRAEFATALSRMLYDVEDGKGKIKYYEPHMAKLYNEGIITNTNPKLKEKRGYVMIMLMRSIKNTAK